MKLFGTDGIRGKVNTHPMTPENVLRVGMAIGKILQKKNSKNMVLIGKDTRLSGYIIESALTSGICSMGMNVTLVGPIPTPGVAFLTKTLRLDAGIVISASHNPYEDNGIKIFSSQGFKLPDRQEQDIEELLTDDTLAIKRPAGKNIGKAFRLEDAAGRYIEYIKSTIPKSENLVGLKVVVDTANGAAYKITPSLLTELGAEVICINDNPNGVNINQNCGSLHTDRLRELVVKKEAHLGIAHDGDADRTLLCNEKGELVDGDFIMAVWAEELKREGALNHDTVVSTVMSNLGLEQYLNERGIKMLRAKVGDRYVVEKMVEGGYNFGGEQSGHIISLNHNTTGDGPVTALQVLHIMKKRGLPFSELSSGIKRYPQLLKNIVVENKKEINDCPELIEAIKEAEKRLEGKGRILVRPSGTEPKIRVMAEGSDADLVDKITDQLVEVVKSTMT